jgi:ribose 5-phosphate isomerase B
MVAMRIVVGADDSHPLVQAVLDWCTGDGHSVELIAEGTAWPDAGRLVGEAVASGSADRGVALCWTGTGVSIAANKVPGVRAALCGDAETARGARRWNDANVLTLSMRATTPTVADEILAAFMSTNDVDPDEIEHIASIP